MGPTNQGLKPPKLCAQINLLFIGCYIIGKPYSGGMLITLTQQRHDLVTWKERESHCITFTGVCSPGERPHAIDTNSYLKNDKECNVICDVAFKL